MKTDTIMNPPKYGFSSLESIDFSLIVVDTEANRGRHSRPRGRREKKKHEGKGEGGRLSDQFQATGSGWSTL
ncbi:hypothetical protein KC19_VG314900 [Ceratodon purpureus]|uniref:Uncharacterized protein n=1 Tax=Ceratodon purpureus TaxID=3225 RepID=A0A8T0HWL5_CERPU|nr:hypothetical protein KC19_VG314900 [Ceratodon purpureus]